MQEERKSHIELDREFVAAYAATFISRYDLYPIQLANGTYISVQKELTDNIVAAHLKGYITIGAYGLDQNGWAKWLCFDADDDKHWHSLLKLAQALDPDSSQPYFEPSRRGGHLWLFTPSIPGIQARRFGKQLLAEHKLEGIELYPKQDRPVTGPGSCVRLPLGIHKLTGKRYPFINLDGQPLAPTIREQMQVLASPRLVSMSFINEMLARAPAPKIVSPTPRFSPTPENLQGNTVSERIKNRISVHDFVTEYIELDSQGRGYCPFHEDEHKSFQVSDDGNFWNCYAGCGGGSIIDFWMKWRKKEGQNGSFKATIRDLAKMLL